MVVHLLPLLNNQVILESVSVFVVGISRCSSELAELFPLRISRGRSTRYSNMLLEFFYHHS